MSTTATLAAPPKAEAPLASDLLERMDRYWRAANYLSVGQIYLLDNPLLKEPLEIRHMVAPRVTVAERLAHLRRLLRQGSFNFEQAVAGEDRVTIAVTLFALLELYKQGELTWTRDEPFGQIEVEAPVHASTTRMTA